VRTKTKQDFEEEGVDDSEESCRWTMEMYDHIQAHMSKVMRDDGITMYERMRKHKDNQGRTPFSLAASIGSVHMFNHLLSKQMTTEWEFGPVICRKLYLDGIDVPLDSESKEKHNTSVLEVTVEHERLDILSQGQMKKILDAKWDKYARGMFQGRFWAAVAFTVVLVFSSVCQPGKSRLWLTLLVLSDVFLVNSHFADFLRECRKIRNNGLRVSGYSIDAFETVYGIMTLPLCLYRAFMHVHRCCYSVCPIDECWENRGKQGLFSSFETLSLSLLSYMTFSNIFIGLMGFPEYGNFALMLIRMLRRDVRIFFTIYSVFLFGFAHAAYVSAGKNNAGGRQFIGSVQECFQAVLQQVDLGEKKNTVDHVIALINFFLVSVVLTNLLIAMLASTFQEISLEAKRKWELLRAVIITKLDMNMADEERTSEANIYWNWERAKHDSKRFMTFTSSENREKYLGGNR